MPPPLVDAEREAAWQNLYQGETFVPPIFKVVDALEARRVGFFIMRDSACALYVIAQTVGKWIEIGVDVIGMIDVSVFVGLDKVEIGKDACSRRSKRTTDEEGRAHAKSGASLAKTSSVRCAGASSEPPRGRSPHLS